MKNKYILIVAFAILTSFVGLTVKAQTSESPSPFKVTADVVSSYIFRGSMATAGPTPNFQPTLSYSKGKYEIGIWGSTDFAGSYKEFDPYVSVTPGQFKFVITDYNWNFGRANYFNYTNSETGHRIEGTAGFTGSKSFPVSITWNTMVYGYDKRADDSTRQAYSTYIELGYSKGATSLFFGFTPWSGLYNNYGVTAFDPRAGKKTFSVVNVGGSFTKSLKITEAFSLPLKTTLIINPSASYSRNDYVHLVFGITF